MGRTSWSNGRYWDGTEAANISLATKKLLESVDSLIPARFTSLSQRATETAAALALIGNPAYPDAQAPMFAVVDGYGACFYDGNTRSGSGGWSWLAENRLLTNVGPYSGATNNTTTGVVIGPGAGDDVVLGSNYRRVRVNFHGTVKIDDAHQSTVWTGCRIRLMDNDSELVPLRIQGIMPPQATFASQFTDQTVSATHDYRWNGSHKLIVNLLSQGGNTTGWVYGEAYLQVIDMGPTD